MVAACSLRGLQGPRSGAQCAARILISGSAGQVDPREVARAQNDRSEVRTTGEVLPELWVLDRERVGVKASTREGWQVVWSSDGAHVRAASELFTTWWERAAPVRR